MNTSSSKTLLMDRENIVVSIEKIAQMIVSEFSESDLQRVAFIGIQRNGVPLANRLTQLINKKCAVTPPVGTLDISMYRDDIGMNKALPKINVTSIPFDTDGKIIILVDDVLQSGRTIRAALDAITDYGRPELIRLAVLIDRGQQEFPIRPDYAGGLIQIPDDKLVVVHWEESDGVDEVFEIIKT